MTQAASDKVTNESVRFACLQFAIGLFMNKKEGTAYPVEDIVQVAKSFYEFLKDEQLVALPPTSSEPSGDNKVVVFPGSKVAELKYGEAKYNTPTDKEPA